MNSTNEQDGFRPPKNEQGWRRMEVQIHHARNQCPPDPGFLAALYRHALITYYGGSGKMAWEMVKAYFEYQVFTLKKQAVVRALRMAGCLVLKPPFLTLHARKCKDDHCFGCCRQGITPPNWLAKICNWDLWKEVI